jgi:hypothetical protein
VIDVLLCTTQCLLSMRSARSVVNKTYGLGKALLGSAFLTRSSHRMQHRFLSESMDQYAVGNKGAFGSNSVRRLCGYAVANSILE